MIVVRSAAGFKAGEKGVAVDVIRFGVAGGVGVGEDIGEAFVEIEEVALFGIVFHRFQSVAEAVIAESQLGLAGLGQTDETILFVILEVRGRAVLPFRDLIAVLVDGVGGFVCRADLIGIIVGVER